MNKLLLVPIILAATQGYAAQEMPKTNLAALIEAGASTELPKMDPKIADAIAKGLELRKLRLAKEETQKELEFAFRRSTNGPEIIHRLLVDNKIDPNMKLDLPGGPFDWTLLQHTVIQRPEYPAITVLVDAGADTNCTTIIGARLLDLVFTNENRQLAERAIALGNKRKYNRADQQKQARRELECLAQPQYANMPYDLIRIIKLYVALPDILPPPTILEIAATKLEDK